jgi:hypothetical protein
MHETWIATSISLVSLSLSHSCARGPFYRTENDGKVTSRRGTGSLCCVRTCSGDLSGVKVCSWTELERATVKSLSCFALHSSECYVDELQGKVYVGKTK